MSNPAKRHYECVRNIGDYLAYTLDDGIYFWHDKPHMNLPEHTMPLLYPDNHNLALLASTENLNSLCTFAN
jgi:hypothetical protein